MPKPISRLPARSLLDHRMCVRRDARHSTTRPSATNTYVAAWKSPSHSVFLSRFSMLVGGYPAFVSM
jgi:hypothetical protein